MCGSMRALNLDAVELVATNGNDQGFDLGGIGFVLKFNVYAEPWCFPVGTGAGRDFQGFQVGRSDALQGRWRDDECLSPDRNCQGRKTLFGREFTVSANGHHHVTEEFGVGGELNGADGRPLILGRQRWGNPVKDEAAQ
jgi:hypothetical protein